MNSSFCRRLFSPITVEHHVRWGGLPQVWAESFIHSSYSFYGPFESR